MTGSSGREAGALPVPVTRFVGRRADVAAVRRALQESRLVTLTGVGGVGKTRLALEVAHQVRRAFPDGAWMVDLSAVLDPEQVPAAVIAALGVVDRSTRPPQDTLADQLRDSRALVVLDNCEHLADACAALLAGLLARTTGVRVLATSRKVLAIPGERLHPVPPLPVPGGASDGTVAVAEVEGCEAVQLLVDRARALQPGFALTEGNVTAVARICARLDGLPLAIELAAARLRTLSPGQLLDRLESRFAVLTGGSRTAGVRQQTLRAMIDWSHALCSEPERLLWARLSVFAGGFDLAAAESVCGDQALPASAVLELLDRLVAQSIVLADPEPDAIRFRLLESLRQYGREHLVTLGEEAALLHRHRDHYLGVASDAADAWCTPGQQAALARLRAEHANLRAAFETSLHDPDGPRVALALVGALRQHWYADAFLAEGRRRLDQALALPSPGTCRPQPGTPQRQPEASGAELARVQALWVSAWVCLLQGDVAVATERLAECGALAERTGDARALGYVASLTGTARLFAGRLPEAREHFETGLATFDRLADHEGALWAMFQLAITLAHGGDPDGARRICEQALALSDRTGERLCRSYTLWVLGFATWSAGDPDGAVRHAREGLALQRDFNDPVGVALIVELLAWVAASRKDPVVATRLLAVADAVWDLIGTTLAAFGPPLVRHRQACEQRLSGRERSGREWSGREWSGRDGGRRAPSVEAAIAAALELTPPAPGDASGATGSGAVPHRAGGARDREARPVTAGPGGPLTAREEDVVRLLARGLSNRAIAGALVISPRTVDGHVERILAKLGFTARTQVAAWHASRDSGPTPLP